MTVGERYRIILKRMMEKAPFRSRQRYHRIGKYYADYSETTQEQLDALPDCSELFRDSVAVNRRTFPS